MKRIAGIMNFDGMPVEPGQIHRMLMAMHAQSGNNPDIWVDGQIGMGASGMGNSSIADDNLFGKISSSSQPIHSHVIAFDGRLDNRPDLFVVLKPIQPILDEGLILLAYAKWGQNCLYHLIGDFAFALWDSEKQLLFCARDHFGVKPFYYYHNDQTYIFASSPSAILASNKVSIKINKERIADFLLDYEGIDKSTTFYKGILRLPPAHGLIVKPKGIKLSRYWQLTPGVGSSFATEGEILEQFQELFKQAIRCRLEVGSPPALMLSGGIDSISIMAVGREILARVGEKKLVTFSGVSENLTLNRETPHIHTVLEQGGLQSCLISETGLPEHLDGLVTLIENEENPFDVLMNLQRVMYRLSRELQVSALLDGVDGDLLLSDSHYVELLWHKGAFASALGETLGAEGVNARYFSTPLRLFFSSLLSAFAPMWARQLRQYWRNHQAPEYAVQNTLISRGFIRSINLDKRFALLDSYHKLLPKISQMEAHKNALEHPNLTAGLERYERIASELSIEARHPLLDIRLVEFCLGLPWHFKSFRGWTKIILRHAVEPLLPPQVVWRTDKDNVMWYFNQLILKARSKYLYQIIQAEKSALAPYLDIQKLENCLQGYQRNGKDHDAENIWKGIALALWLRRQRNLNK
jgi:asparagine synthase (glutamine-hydrolysing)